MIPALKDGVDIRFLRPELTSYLLNIQAIFEFWGCADQKGFVFRLTAGRDGKHKINSKHYKDLAIDVRIRTSAGQFLADATIGKIIHDLKTLLGPDYDIVWHRGSHIHIEYDP